MTPKTDTKPDSKTDPKTSSPSTSDKQADSTSSKQSTSPSQPDPTTTDNQNDMTQNTAAANQLAADPNLQPRTDAPAQPANEHKPENLGLVTKSPVLPANHTAADLDSTAPVPEVPKIRARSFRVTNTTCPTCNNADSARDERGLTHRIVTDLAGNKLDYGVCPACAGTGTIEQEEEVTDDQGQPSDPNATNTPRPGSNTSTDTGSGNTGGSSKPGTGTKAA